MRIALFPWLVIALLGFTYAYTDLDTISLRQLDKLSSGRLNLNESDPLNHFKHFNKTRIPGSKNSADVQQYILNHFESLNQGSELQWEVELDTFIENGYNFTNLIFSKQPKYSSSSSQSSKYLVIAAHYDSLIKPDGFIGAIDSAVSCGILLDLAQTLTASIDSAFQDFDYDLNTGIKFIFFDGEEAFKQWSPSDSIYGARHLYAKWAGESKVKDIELFLLLDLLGAADFNFVPNYFEKTHENYNDLSNLENKLVYLFPSIFGSYQTKFLEVPEVTYNRKHNVYIEDDHVPFLQAGVPVLHLIPHVFPKQWHTIDDDFNHIDLRAIDKWNTLLRAYILEYLEIPEIVI